MQKEAYARYTYTCSSKINITVKLFIYTLNNISWFHDSVIGNFSSYYYKPYYYSKLLVQLTFKPYTIAMLINTLFMNLIASKCRIEANK